MEQKIRIDRLEQLGYKKSQCANAAAGLQLPGSLPNDGFIHSMHKPDSPVKPNSTSQIQRKVNRRFSLVSGSSLTRLPSATKGRMCAISCANGFKITGIIDKTKVNCSDY